VDLRMQPRNEKFFTLFRQGWLERRRARRPSHEVRRSGARALGELRADIDAGTIPESVYGPVWLRLLVTRAHACLRGHDPRCGDGGPSSE
jgi:hypothetical protein